MYKKLHKKYKKYYGQFVITEGWRVAKFVSVVECYDDNYYLFITDEGIVMESCVGGLLPLKNKISKKDYTRMEYIFDINKYEEKYSKEINKIKAEALAWKLTQK